jgi:hypothetical protein
VQTFYFEIGRGPLKRHDYEVDVAGGAPAAHYVSASPTSRDPHSDQAHDLSAQPDGNAAPAPLVVSIDISDIEFK